MFRILNRTRSAAIVAFATACDKGTLFTPAKALARAGWLPAGERSGTFIHSVGSARGLRLWGWGGNGAKQENLVMMTKTAARTTIRCLTCLTIMAVAGQGTASASIITGAGPGGLPTVHCYQYINGNPTLNFNAFGLGFNGGVRVAGGHVSGNATGEVITASGPGSAPQIKIYHGVTSALISSFQPYSVSYTGGVFVAGGDITGDDIDEVITGTDQGAAPNVKAFSATTGAVLRSFFAFEPGFLGGARVAAGDVNGDGLDDIVVGRGPGGSSEVRVFDGGSGVQIRSFLAFPASFTGGIFVAAGDVNGDGHADVVVSADAGSLPEVKVFDGVTSIVLTDLNAFASNFAGGVRVAATDLTSDGRAEIIACEGAGGTGEIRVLHGLSGALLGSRQISGQSFAQGLWIAANPRASICHADVAPLAGGDELVNIDDLLTVISAWGPCPTPPASCPANIVNTGLSATVVNIDDLLAVISAWGPCP